uniref:hypothetical protein n=1 Tax=Stenotrophomonas indicatrix TaxID=2045451 RepID=UPI0028A1FAAE
NAWPPRCSSRCARVPKPVLFSAAANERLLAGQAEFLTQSQALQERLATSLQQSLREGAEASALQRGRQ